MFIGTPCNILVNCLLFFNSLFANFFYIYPSNIFCLFPSYLFTYGGNQKVVKSLSRSFCFLIKNFCNGLLIVESKLFLNMFETPWFWNVINYKIKILKIKKKKQDENHSIVSWFLLYIPIYPGLISS